MQAVAETRAGRLLWWRSATIQHRVRWRSGAAALLTTQHALEDVARRLGQARRGARLRVGRYEAVVLLGGLGRGGQQVSRLIRIVLVVVHERVVQVIVVGQQGYIGMFEQL